MHALHVMEPNLPRLFFAVAFVALAIIYVYIINPDEDKASATFEPCMFLVSLMYFSVWCYIMVFEG